MKNSTGTQDIQIDTAYDLFVHDLRAMLYLEQRLEEELGDMADQVTNDDLSEALIHHRDDTSDHAQRLHRIFEILEENPRVHESADYRGIFQETHELSDRIIDPDMLDLAYLNSAIKVERIELSAYESLLRLARNLDSESEVEDFDKVEELLQDNLESEKNALKQLKALSKGSWLQKMVERLMS